MTDLIHTPPAHWRRLPDLEFPTGNPAATRWEHKLTGLHVIRSQSLLNDGEYWVHVSVSRADRMPSWAELSKIKNEFIGEDKEAYQVLAADKDHVNVHAFCLHLWSPMDGKRRVANLQDLKWERAL